MQKSPMIGVLAVAALLAGSGYKADTLDKDTPPKENKRPTARTGTITGKVTYDGKPVPVGIINIHPAKGIGVLAEIQNGKFTADMVPPGPVTITINTALHRGAYRNIERMMKSGGGLLPQDATGNKNIKDKPKDAE